MKETVWMKCETCGQLIEVVNVTGAEIICCGKPMTQQEERITGEWNEKHIPVPAGEQNAGSYHVIVGTVPHPMTPEHYIEWIELQEGSLVFRKYLEPSDAPEAVFPVSGRGDIRLRSYCNKHGLWGNPAPEKL